MNNSSLLKNFLGNIPYSADLYDSIRRSRPNTRYNLEQLAKHLPLAVEQARPFIANAKRGKKLLLFATLHYWIEQAAIVGLALRGLGHDVTIAYLPYHDWRKDINKFDLRRQDLYTRRVLSPLDGLVHYASLLDIKPAPALSANLSEDISLVSVYDAQYTDQVEDVDKNSAIYKLRLQHNDFAARTALSLMQDLQPDVVLIPNGTITELGAVYRVARHLDLRTVTYEFNDQREQVWIAQNDEVMRQNTDLLWAARGGKKLTKPERALIEELESARMGGKAFGKSVRKWQDVETKGGEQLRKELGLDKKRPVVLLATNVLGDSLTLGRNIFARSMADWIAKTVQFFAGRPGRRAEPSRSVQLVIRIHPGERLTHGPSMADVVKGALAEVPENIHLIGPLEKVNTYDLMEIADLGLVYTTTTGLEMAMNGIPVIVCGETHYRKRGFTLDPMSWDEYYALIDQSSKSKKSLMMAQIETAWEYAYRFFFEYPLVFPWRLMHFWKDMEVWPMTRILSDEGQKEFGRTFEYLAGEPITWKT
jgi:Capsule polysaccharide biosynthesis protein